MFVIPAQAGIQETEDGLREKDLNAYLKTPPPEFEGEHRQPAFLLRCFFSLSPLTFSPNRKNIGTKRLERM